MQIEKRTAWIAQQLETFPYQVELMVLPLSQLRTLFSNVVFQIEGSSCFLFSDVLPVTLPGQVLSDAEQLGLEATFKIIHCALVDILIDNKNSRLVIFLSLILVAMGEPAYPVEKLRPVCFIED